MAKQNGPFIFEMTICSVSFYKRGERGYVRMKSNLTRKRWLSDPAFEGSRQSAANMAQASPLASYYYRTIPAYQRQYAYYRRMVGIAQEMLCAGFGIQHLKQVLEYTVRQLLRKLAKAENKTSLSRSSFSTIHSLKFQPATTIAALPNTAALKLQQVAVTSSLLLISLPPIGIQPRGQPAKLKSDKELSRDTLTQKSYRWQGSLCPQVPFSSLNYANRA